MAENYEKLLVVSETFEPFVLCLALGTLEAIKSEIWLPEAGIWTVGRPNFLDQLEKMQVSEETMNILVEFDELAALESLDKADFDRELAKIEETIKTRLRDFSENYWQAKWLTENS